MTSFANYQPFRRRTLLVTALLACICAPSMAREWSGAAPLARMGAATGYVAAISDGDTMYVVIDGQRTRVRLANIDAPESGQAFGRRSEQSLRELAWKQQVQVSWRDIDRYSRPVVEVVNSQGIAVNAEQVRRGFAWVYRQYNKDPGLYALETAAKQARIGLWADPSPQPPWEWRKEQRGGQP